MNDGTHGSSEGEEQGKGREETEDGDWNWQTRPTRYPSATEVAAVYSRISTDPGCQRRFPWQRHCLRGKPTTVGGHNGATLGASTVAFWCLVGGSTLQTCPPRMRTMMQDRWAKI